MTRTRALVFVAVLAVGCTSAPPERQVVDDAAAALGGADRIQSLKALHITGSGTAPNAGQNRMPDDELPVWKVTEYTRAIDLANGRTRVQQVREAQFLFAGATVQRADAGARRRRRLQRRRRTARDAGRRGRSARSSDRAAASSDHHRARGAGSRGQADQPSQRGRRAARRRDHGCTATRSRSRSMRRPTCRRACTSMSDNANMGDVAIVDDVLRLRGRRRREAAEAADDQDGQVPAVRSAGVEEHGRRRRRRPGGARRREVGAGAGAAAGGRHRRSRSRKGIWWLAGSGNHRSIVFEFDDHLVAVRGAAQRGALEGGHRQGADAQSEAADARRSCRITISITRAGCASRWPKG